MKKSKSTSLFKTLPCLRCACPSVSVIVPVAFERLSANNLICERCGAQHWLIAEVNEGVRLVVYDRDTRRYPADFYDAHPDVTVTLKNADFGQERDTPFPSLGPIIVFERRRFSTIEIRQIWRSTNGKCQICEKVWKLSARGKSGWHVDHVIPNIGGGVDTEAMNNFKVACARCNLKKGRGHTSRTVRQAAKL